jgi:hypothetical protein
VFLGRTKDTRLMAHMILCLPIRVFSKWNARPAKCRSFSW